MAIVLTLSLRAVIGVLEDRSAFSTAKAGAPPAEERRKTEAREKAHSFVAAKAKASVVNDVSWVANDDRVACTRDTDTRAEGRASLARFLIPAVEFTDILMQFCLQNQSALDFVDKPPTVFADVSVAGPHHGVRGP